MPSVVLEVSHHVLIKVSTIDGSEVADAIHKFSASIDDFQVGLHNPGSLANLCSSDKCDRSFIPAIRSIVFNLFSLLVPGYQENQVMRHVNQSASSRTKHMMSSTREAWFLSQKGLRDRVKEILPKAATWNPRY